MDISISLAAIVILAVIIVILVIYLYKRGATPLATTQAPTTTQAQAERFSPYVSTQAHDMPRDDPSSGSEIGAGDVKGRSSEDILFLQLRGVTAFPPTTNP